MRATRRNSTCTRFLAWHRSRAGLRRLQAVQLLAAAERHQLGRSADSAGTPRRSRTLWLRRPAAADVAAIIADQATQELSYAEVGATTGQLPGGYRHDQYSADLGPFSQSTFERAAATLLGWGVQAGAGMSVLPGETVQDGATFALVFRLPFGGYVTAPGTGSPGSAARSPGSFSCAPPAATWPPCAGPLRSLAIMIAVSYRRYTTTTHRDHGVRDARTPVSSLGLRQW